jgi:hypothetical protein
MAGTLAARGGGGMSNIRITNEVRDAARMLLRNPALTIKTTDRYLLADITAGKRKVIDAAWWQKVHTVVDQVKLEKLQRLSDPAANPNEHEREVASRKVEEFKARTPPGLRAAPPPLPADISQWQCKRTKSASGCLY